MALPDEVDLASKCLEERGFKTIIVSTFVEARKAVLQVIPKGSLVGLADSASVRQSGVLDDLRLEGSRIIDPWSKQSVEEPGLRRKLMRQTLGSDVFLTSCNAVTLDGKIVSIDGSGNRVANMIYGCERVVLLVGQNKIVPDVEAALKRIKNVIAPYHAQQKHNKTPCAATGKCNECRSPDRLCRITVILEFKPRQTDLTVVLVREDLGLSWDPSWPQERIDKIKLQYDRRMAPSRQQAR